MAFQSFTPIEYLMLDVANGYGLDKKDFSERLDWFEQNQHQLDKVLHTAKDPAHFFAAVEAYRAALRGEPIGHMVSWDATASGLQILAAASCDRKAAQLCNVVDTGHRENAYANIHQTLQAKVGDHTPLDADDVKLAVMTSFYGSKAVPKEVFGEDILPAYYETLVEEAEGPWLLNEAFLDMWDSKALSYSWVMPDGFHVQTKVMNTLYEEARFMGQAYTIKRKVNAPIEEGRALGANITHSVDGFAVREMVARCGYNPVQVQDVSNHLAYGRGTSHTRAKDKRLAAVLAMSRQSGYLSSVVLDLIDEHNVGLVNRGAVQDLINSLPAKPFHLVTNHD